MVRPNGDFDVVGEGCGAFRGRNSPGRAIRGRIARPIPTILGRVGVDGFGGMKSSVASENHPIAEMEEGKAAAVPIGEFAVMMRKWPQFTSFSDCEPRMRWSIARIANPFRPRAGKNVRVLASERPI